MRSLHGQVAVVTGGACGLGAAICLAFAQAGCTVVVGYNSSEGPARTIADNLVETSHMFRSKVQEVDATISDVNHRARAQTERVDDMVSSVLNTTSDIASTITRGVQVPVRAFHGVMSGLKAGLDVLTGRNNHRSPQSSHETPDL